MRFRSSARVVAGSLVLAVVATACGGSSTSKSKQAGGGSKAASGPSGTGSVTLAPLAVRTGADGKSSGTTNPVSIKISDSSDGKLRVGFSEDEVAGTGDQWRAAGWGAVTVATLLTGAPLKNRDVQFDVSGFIDGPSAGALMTVGTLALLRGDKIQSDITMTGTINPDGTVGPVGGIPYKLDGALAAKKKRVLIPLGQRNSPDDSGTSIDVVELGRRKGLEVTEVGNVYDAYKAFTGKELPRPAQASSTKLDEAAYQKFKAKTTSWLAKFDSAAGQFNSLAPDVQQVLQGLVDQANEQHTNAVRLTGNGLQAGAFTAAVQAAGLADAAVAVGRDYQTLVTQGVQPFVSQIESSQSIDGQVQGLVDELKTFTPSTVSDAGALIAAYGTAVDAISSSSFGAEMLKADTGTSEQAVQNAVMGAVLYEIAGTLVDAAKDLLDVGRDLGGAKLGGSVDLHDVAEFFRKGGEANLNAFESVIVAPNAESANISEAAAKSIFARNDFDYAAALASVNVMANLKQYFGDGAAADYAEIGGSAQLFTRASGLLAKYYSLGDVDTTTFSVKGIANDAAFTEAINLASSQASSAIGALRDKQVNPTLAASNFEIAGVQRESGDAGTKLTGLSSYWDAYVGARILAYLGGFARL